MISTILILLVSTIPFLLTILLVFAANARKLNRYEQVLLPAIALIFGIFAVVFFNDLHNLIGSILILLGRYLPFLNSFNPTFLEAVVFNCLFMVSFAIIKCVYKLVLKLVAKPFSKIYKGLFGFFYGYDSEYEHWYLHESYIGVRRLFKNLFIAIVCVSLILFFLSNQLSDTAAFRNPFYPAFAVVVLGEIYYFLAGITKHEYKEELDFEDDQSKTIIKLARTQKILEHYFGDRLLRAFSRGRSRGAAEAHHDFCEALIRSDDFPERLSGAYFMSLVDQGLLGWQAKGNYDELNHDTALETVNLLRGKSVMFASPFYQDYLPYIFFPMNAELMRGGKVLVLHGGTHNDVHEDVTSKDNLAKFLSDGLTFVTNIQDIWTIGRLSDDGSQRPDVATLSLSSLGNASYILENADFLKQVGFVLVLDPSSILATYQIGISILSEYLSEGREPTYCIFDKNSDGLVDSLSHALRTNITEVGATEFCSGSSVGMLWSVDGEFLQHRLMPDIARYLGGGAELGLVALKSQVGKVAWISKDSVPIMDQRWILGQYYGELMGFAELPQEQAQLDRSFEWYPDLWSIRKKPYRFIVAEDEYSNLFEAYRQFSTRGSDQSFVNILAPNYLLREYMTVNADIFMKDPKAIPSFAPDYSKSQRNVVFSLVMMMIQGGRRVSEEEIASRLRYVGLLDDRSIQEALEGMFIEFFDAGVEDDLPESHILIDESEEYLPELRDMVTRRYYRLGNDARYSAAFQALKDVPLITEAPDGSEVLLGTRLFGLVNQLYLPGQFIVVGGKYYEVLSTNPETGIVLRRAADHFTKRRYYRQLRRYSITGWSDGERVGDSRTLGSISVKLGSANIAIDTLGYLELDDYGNLKDTHKVALENVPARVYPNKGLLRVDLNGAPNHVVTTLAVLISEACKTLYPKDYPYIAILTDEHGELPEGVLYENEPFDDGGVIYIVEDSLMDIGLISSIGRNMSRILELCWDYLDWHHDMLHGVKDEVETFALGELPELPKETVKKPGLFKRIFNRLKAIFKSRKRPKEEPDAVPEAQIEPTHGDLPKDELTEESEATDASIEAVERGSDELEDTGDPKPDSDSESLETEEGNGDRDGGNAEDTMETDDIDSKTGDPSSPSLGSEEKSHD